MGAQFAHHDACRRTRLGLERRDLVRSKHHFGSGGANRVGVAEWRQRLAAASAGDLGGGRAVAETLVEAVVVGCAERRGAPWTPDPAEGRLALTTAHEVPAPTEGGGDLASSGSEPDGGTVGGVEGHCVGPVAVEQAAQLPALLARVHLRVLPRAR